LFHLDNKCSTMKKLNKYTFLFLSTLFILSLSSCDSERLSDLDIDILGEWLVDDFVFSGNDLADNGAIQDMHFLFSNNYDVELSWFENGDFLVVDGRWSSDENESILELNLDDRLGFFCGDDDMIFNIFFFAGDMELEASCADGNWMEIQLERL